MSKNFSEREASEEWGPSVHWFRRKRWSGGGPKYIKVSDGRGGKVLYPEDSLREFFTSRIRKSTSDTDSNHAAKKTGAE